MTRLLNNNKALLFIIAILLIANVAVLAFFLSMKPGMKRDFQNDRDKPRISDFLKEEVKFSSGQLKEYDSLKKIHWSDIKPMFKSMNASKDSFYHHVSDVTIDSAVLSNLADSIAIKQKALDLQMFNHFRNTRNLCTPDQLPVYDSSVQEVIRKMISPLRKHDNDKMRKQDKGLRDKA